jgi:DNA invertase Pin-like site-specific DNA recombinase
MSKRVAIYARVSTGEQTCENLLLELRSVADRQGWEIVREYVDEGISGSKGRDKRPELDMLLKACIRRDIDMVMASSVDRIGRSLSHLIDFLSVAHSKGVQLYLHQQGIDTSTASGLAMFQMLGVFSQFEHSMIQERVRSGLARARAQGVTLGRPRTDPSIEAGIRDALLRKDKGVRKIAREFGVGTSVVQRVQRSLSV